MEEIEFNSKEELYKRLKPALYSKKMELIRENIDFIKEEDIWNYLVKYVWKNKRNLTINDLTCDILYVNSKEVVDYVLNKLKEEKREVNNYSEELL